MCTSQPGLPQHQPVHMMQLSWSSQNLLLQQQAAHKQQQQHASRKRLHPDVTDTADTADSSAQSTSSAADSSCPINPLLEHQQRIKRQQQKVARTYAELAAAVGWRQLREQDPDLEALCATWLAGALDYSTGGETGMLEPLFTGEIADLGAMFWEACGRALAVRLFGDASMAARLDAACDWGLPELACDLQAALSISTGATAAAAAAAAEDVADSWSADSSAGLARTQAAAGATAVAVVPAGDDGCSSSSSSSSRCCCEQSVVI